MTGKATMTRIRDEEILLDLPEAMDFLRASRSTIYRLMKTGQLVGYKIGRKWVFYKKDVKELVESGRTLLEQ